MIEQEDAEFLRTTPVERKKLKKRSQRFLRTSRSPGKGVFQETVFNKFQCSRVPGRFMSTGFGNGFSSKAGTFIS